jgi:hypothetical protein
MHLQAGELVRLARVDDRGVAPIDPISAVALAYTFRAWARTQYAADAAHVLGEAVGPASPCSAAATSSASSFVPSTVPPGLSARMTIAHRRVVRRGARTACADADRVGAAEARRRTSPSGRRSR